MSERLNLSREDVIKLYPDLAGYLSTHDVAQLMKGRRLMSAEEKIDRFGGIDQVGNNIDLAKRQRSEQPYIVLLACETEPMTGVEIARFAYFATKAEYLFPVASLYVTLSSLLRDDLIERVKNITLITLFGERSNISNTSGYLSKGGKAVRRKVQLLEKAGDEGSLRLGGLAPYPRPT